MSKHSEQFKLEVVKQYLSGEAGFKELGRRDELGYSMIRRWVERYREHGGSGLRKKFSHYSAEFKLSVLQYMWDNHLSMLQAAVKFDIRDHGMVGRWERAYREGGVEALASRPRGKPRPMATLVPTQDSPPEDDKRSREEFEEEGLRWSPTRRAKRASLGGVSGESTSVRFHWG